MGHAGSDVEIAYRSRSAIEADYARDPLLGTARALVRHGVRTRDDVLADYEAARADVMAAAAEVRHEPRLATRAEVIAPLAVPDPPARVAARSLAPAEGALTLAQAINRSLADALADRDDVLVLGQDVGRKGGVYGVTRGLQKRFGTARVLDTLLDEQTILGTALGASLAGFLPVPEIQYLAYLHNAEDQLRGEAASLRFFSNGQYRNGMVVRVAGFAYQRGFGGHFHNDSSVAVLRDIPGVVVGCAQPPGATRPACSARASTWPGATAGSASSWSRSRSTTPATWSRATDSGPPPTRPTSSRSVRSDCTASLAPPICSSRRTATASTSACGPRPRSSSTGSRRRSSTCGGSPRSPSPPSPP